MKTSLLIACPSFIIHFVYKVRLTMVSGLPWVMKEWDWFFGTTAFTSGTLSLMPCNMTGDRIEIQVIIEGLFHGNIKIKCQI